MIHKLLKYLSLLLLIFILVLPSVPAFSKDTVSLVDVTPEVIEYATGTVKPILDSFSTTDRLSLLLKVSDILIDPEAGVQINSINPGTYIVYDMLDKIKLGFLKTFKLTSEQKQILKAWHSKYMDENPADVFFAPSAHEIIKTKAAFGCSHYARSFIAVVKALGLINNPEDMRYVVSCKADDYNEALEKSDIEMTINGHQFVMVRIDGNWIAINTSKSEWSAMPEGFSPDSVSPPKNIPVQFESYPDLIFLLRKIGNDYNDDCNDDSLSSLMNIYRSGDTQDDDFNWKRYY
jgi:hypothetical protein